MNKMYGMNAACDLASLISVNTDKADSVLNELFESYFCDASSEAFQSFDTCQRVQNLVMVVMDYIANAKKQTRELINMITSQKEV